MYIKVGLDFGNNTICAVSKLEKQLIYKYISSTFTRVTTFTDDNIITTDGMTIQLGVRNGSELTSIDKTDRLFLKHQILWAVNAIFGTTSNDNIYELDLAVGLPVGDFSDLEKRANYIEKLNSLGTISGVVDGNEFTVIVNKVMVLSEGHGSIKALLDKIPNNGYPTVIHDIGFLTTDVVVLEYEKEKLKIRKPITINKGVSYIYDSIFEEMSELECIESKSELDYYVRNKYDTIRTKHNKDYMLTEQILNKSLECKTIMNDISNKLGFKTTTCNKIFIGGGSVLLFKIVGSDWIKNHVEIDNNLRYCANALGYYYNI